MRKIVMGFAAAGLLPPPLRLLRRLASKSALEGSASELAMTAATAATGFMRRAVSIGMQTATRVADTGLTARVKAAASRSATVFPMARL